MNSRHDCWLRTEDFDCLQRLVGYDFPQKLKHSLIRIYGFSGQRMQWLKDHDRYSQVCGAWCCECQICGPYREDTVISQIEHLVGEYRNGLYYVADFCYEQIRRQMDIRNGLMVDEERPF